MLCTFMLLRTFYNFLLFVTYLKMHFFLRTIIDTHLITRRDLIPQFEILCVTDLNKRTHYFRNLTNMGPHSSCRTRYYYSFTRFWLADLTKAEICGISIINFKFQINKLKQGLHLINTHTTKTVIFETSEIKDYKKTRD